MNRYFKHIVACPLKKFKVTADQKDFNSEINHGNMRPTPRITSSVSSPLLKLAQEIPEKSEKTLIAHVDIIIMYIDCHS